MATKPELTPAQQTAIEHARNVLADFDALVGGRRWAELNPVQMGAWAGSLAENLRIALRIIGGGS